MSSRRWALKRESYENRSAVSVHVGQSDRRGQLNVSINEQTHIPTLLQTDATENIPPRYAIAAGNGNNSILTCCIKTNYL